MSTLCLEYLWCNITRSTAFLSYHFVFRCEDSETEICNTYIVLLVIVNLVDQNVVYLYVSVDNMSHMYEV